MASGILRQNVFSSLLCAAVIFYLCFHTVHGEQGLYALLVENHRQEKLQAEWEGLRQKRLFLEHKVALMRDNSLDPDLLDEESRRFLGVIGKNEILLITAE